MFHAAPIKFREFIICFVAAVTENLKLTAVVAGDETERHGKHGMLTEVARNVADFDSVAAFAVRRERFNPVQKILLIEMERRHFFA